MLAHFTALKRWTLSAVIRLQILCAMFLIVSFSSTARAEDGLSPFSAYELRLSQDTVLQTIAEAKLRLATAEFLPKVNVGGDWVVDGNIRYSPDITAASPGSYSKKDPSLMGVEVSWKLFDGFQNINNRAAAEEGCHMRSRLRSTRARNCSWSAPNAFSASSGTALFSRHRRMPSVAVGRPWISPGRC